MRIIIGSTNKAKVSAVKRIFPDAEIEEMKVNSGVNPQPVSDEETRQGAINRAKNSKDQIKGSYGIGLEGGVMYVKNQLYLCNWGALVTPENVCFTASGARILLPQKISTQLAQGMELGEVMREWTKKEDIRQNLGAVGVFTNKIISREAMFAHVVQLLRGQAEYNHSFSDND